MPLEKSKRHVCSTGSLRRARSELDWFFFTKDITRLLSLAASSISHLTLPQTDEPNENLPQGEERSEAFVIEVNEYFERLDVRIQDSPSPPLSN
jgi:hypothetical protein